MPTYCRGGRQAELEQSVLFTAHVKNVSIFGSCTGSDKFVPHEFQFRHSARWVPNASTPSARAANKNDVQNILKQESSCKAQTNRYTCLMKFMEEPTPVRTVEGGNEGRGRLLA